MRYILAFNFFALKPKTGWKNVLSVGVILLIPIVGQMVVYGYRSFVFEDLDDDPDKRYHRDFSFNHFSDYLARGLWIALIQIAAQLILGVGSYIAMLAIMLGGGLQGAPMPVMIGLVVGWVLSLMAASLVVAMILWPMEIHAALKQPFQFGAALAFARTFQSAMWKECLAAILSFLVLAAVFSTACYLVVAGLAVGVGFALGSAVSPEVGILVGALIYVGLFLVLFLPFIGILTMANGHILAQLYSVYVDKGGEPLRVRDPFEADPMLDRRDEE